MIWKNKDILLDCFEGFSGPSVAIKREEKEIQPKKEKEINENKSQKKELVIDYWFNEIYYK